MTIRLEDILEALANSGEYNTMFVGELPDDTGPENDLTDETGPEDDLTAAESIVTLIDTAIVNAIGRINKLEDVSTGTLGTFETLLKLRAYYNEL